MTTHDLGSFLSEWADKIERLRWSAVLIDEDWRLAWMSPELLEFLPKAPPSAFGIGEHVLGAFLKDAWLKTVDPESQARLFLELSPYIVSEVKREGKDPAVMVPERFRSLLEQVDATDVPTLATSWFWYLDPSGDPDLPRYRVNAALLVMRDQAGRFIGGIVLFITGVRPNLLTLLSRGNEEMYERMARLVEPKPREAAILFCDLHESGMLARQLSSASYFRLVRRLWTGIDDAVARSTGIIGKHAGDGASAFFLAKDCGSASAASAAAIRTAREIHEISYGVFSEMLGDEGGMKVGIHWGGNLFMGQLVPGGRLDVTALGDEVNEAARVQEVAPVGATFVTKQLVEHLDPEDAASLGIDVEKLTYVPVKELPEVGEKAIRDAGNIPVAAI